MSNKLRDIGWKHGTAVTTDKKKTQCNYCHKVMGGGITRLKKHIAGVRGEVAECQKCPRETAQMMNKALSEAKRTRESQKRKKELLNSPRDEAEFERHPRHSIDDHDEFNGGDFQGDEMSGHEQAQSKYAVQENRTTAFHKEDARRHSTSDMASHPFKHSRFCAGPSQGGPSAPNSGPYYKVMIDSIAECGPGVVGSTRYQTGGISLNEKVKELTEYLGSMKSKWSDYGCTIICEGLSFQNKHPITNFMIYCDGEMVFHKSVDNTNVGSRTVDYLYRLMDKVVEEVGEQYIVQIVTDNEALYKEAGLKLMEKRKHLFWSPCAAQCIDLMLEDIGKIENVDAVITDARKITSYIYNNDALVKLMRTFTDNKEILRPGIARFATEYIAIESLLRQQFALKKMFSSHEFQVLPYSSNREKMELRTYVSNLMLNEQFWQRAKDVRAMMKPLIMVLKVVDQDKKPTLGVIYDCMDRAKMEIKDSCTSWSEIWSIIDKRWETQRETQLHTHLHAVAYYLNPAFQYSNRFSDNEKFRKSLKVVTKRIEPDVAIQSKVLTEEKLFREAREEFGQDLTKKSRTTCLPAEWWYIFGESAPNLRKIAIKVLSQTCSSSGCERNWSTFALIHTKIQNCLAMKKLEQLVYVHYNLRLLVRNRLTKKKDDDYEDILDSWIRESEEPLLSHTDEWLQEGIQELSGDDDHENEIEGSSRSQGQGWSGSVEPRTSGQARDAWDGGGNPTYRFADRNSSAPDGVSYPVPPPVKSNPYPDDPTPGTGGNFDFSTNNGIELDSFALNIDPTYGFADQNPSAPDGVSYPVPPPVKSNPYPDDPTPGTGGNFDFSTNNGIELDSFVLNIDPTYGFADRNLSAPDGVSYPVPPPVKSNPYPDDPTPGTGGNFDFSTNNGIELDSFALLYQQWD